MKTKDVHEVTDEEFVTLWLDAYKRDIGLTGLTQEQGWMYVLTSGRASKLRRAGVKLPTMKAPGTKNAGLEVNTSKLNELIVKVLGDEALNWRNR